MVKENTVKPTEIGLIPEDWKIDYLNKITDLVTDGAHLSPPTSRYGFPIVTVENINKGFINLESCRVISEKDYLYLVRNNCKPINGDVLLSKDGTIGITFTIKDSPNVVLLSSIALIRPNKTLLNGEYLSHVLSSYWFYIYLNRVQAGSALTRIVLRDIKNFYLALPSLPEQEAIAEVLSDADAWIESLEQLISKKRLIKQGAIQELLSPKEDWEERKLGELGEVKMCKRIFQYQTSEFGEIPFYKIGTFGKIPDAFISRNHYQDFKNKFSFPKKGEILISAAGTIGRTVVYDGEECYFQDSNIVWINNEEEIVSNEFLKYILEVVKYNTEGGTIQRLYNSILKNTIFHCPSLTEQTRIATILSDMDAELEALEAQLGKVRKVKQGMMQELLTGRVRLV